MNLDNNTLIKAIDRSSFLFPKIKNRIEYLSVDGVFGFETNVSHPYTNMVGLARFDEDNAAAKVREVFEVFAQRKQAFGWLVGPTSRPPCLGQVLEQQGMTKTVDLLGMATDRLSLEVRPNPKVRVVEGSKDDQDLAVEVMSKAYPLQAEACDLYISAFHRRTDLHTRVYFAYFEGTNKPVSIAFSMVYPEYPIALLGGSATLPDFRHNGIYSIMVQRRLKDAEKAGAQAVVIQAVKQTSAPICQKLGFHRLCDLTMFVHDAPSS